MPEMIHHHTITTKSPRHSTSLYLPVLHTLPPHAFARLHSDEQDATPLGPEPYLDPIRNSPFQPSFFFPSPIRDQGTTEQPSRQGSRQSITRPQRSWMPNDPGKTRLQAPRGSTLAEDGEQRDIDPRPNEGALSETNTTLVRHIPSSPRKRNKLLSS
jgi:hypothetical protein